MDDLVEWLKRQLDEDERVAREARDLNPGSWIPSGTGTVNAVEVVSGMAITAPVAYAKTGAAAVHIAHWNPDRELHEVEAKRRRLQRHQPVEDWVGHDHMPSGRRLIGVNCSTCRDGTCGDDYDIYCAPIAWPCPEIRDDLSVYSGRPGYQEEWRPA